MKLSLAWIFDHIKGDWKDIDVPHLIAQFNATTAEIEEVYHTIVDINCFTIGHITAISDQEVTVYSHEWKKEFMVPMRKHIALDQYYLIKKTKKEYSWASLTDWGSEKDGLMPAISCTDLELKGSWKEKVEKEDYIIVLDNKSVTNRPDLWGHRGFAREIAILLKKQLIPEEHLLEAKPIKHYVLNAPSTSTNPFNLEIISDQGACDNVCKRLAGLYIPKIEYKPSLISIAHRLARIDSRPINLLVDGTNYVMFDIGQPMHAFDAATLKSESIQARCAHEGESITLLDGEVVKLTTSDYILSDGQKPIALAGIMGGMETAVNPETSSLFIEAANFDAATIRKTATRLKKRTEASTRFEKSLDPNQNTQALLRYLKLLALWDVSYQAADAIVSIGSLVQERVITIMHELIVQRIGMTISSDTIESCLITLGFGVQTKFDATNNENKTTYYVTVPTYRGTKDVIAREDIIEEIARSIGYTHIPHVLPARQMAAFSVHVVQRTRIAKHQLAYGLYMHETQNYAFYDEEFLKQLAWEPTDTLMLKNPFSQNMQRLVTSLVPHLLKCIAINHTKADTLRFFELNRIWLANTEALEQKHIAGIFYEHKKTIDFYQAKELLTSLFEALQICVEWTKPLEPLAAWYNPDQSAHLLYKDHVIGTAGKVEASMLKHIVQGDAFIFELDADFLLSFEPQIEKFVPLPKFPEVHIDISMFVPLSITVQDLEHAIYAVDKRIRTVELVDYYQKDEWLDQKAVTLRFTAYDQHKTLVKEEIDSITHAVTQAVQEQGVTVR